MSTYLNLDVLDRPDGAECRLRVRSVYGSHANAMRVSHKYEAAKYCVCAC